MASISTTSPLSLGWYCLIETLADSKQAELPLLKELINRVPNFYTDAPESVRERVSLRYLEECASRGVLSGSVIGISQSTEELLCQNIIKPVPSETSQSRTLPISDDIRQFISQKRSTLPKSSLELLKESGFGTDVKLPSANVDGSSSRHHQGDKIFDKKQEVTHKQKDNAVDDKQEMIDSPSPSEVADSLDNDTSQSLPSHDGLSADKIANGPLQENIPTTIGNESNLEATGSEPLSDDVNQFIFKRRVSAEKTSVEEHKEPTPETCIPTEPTRNVNHKKMRFNADLLDDLSDYEFNYIGSEFLLSELNQCIVCNEEGQLLTCSRKGCGLTMHESCIVISPSSFDKEGQFYCPCCACTRASGAYARAKKALSLAKESLSSFLKLEKDQNQEKEEKGKQQAEKNINDKSTGKLSDGGSDATPAGFSEDASSDSQSASRDGRRRVREYGKRKEKQVQWNGRNVSEDWDMHCGRAEEAKRRKADSACAQLDKYAYVKSGPGATSGTNEAVSINEEEAGNERRREERTEADVTKKRHRPKPRYSNKVAAPRRRNMLPWSAEEEQALREGMQKFGITSDGRIPWSEILEYHQNIFHKTRLPTDLKDKWRNMMKKEGSKAS